MEVTGKTGVKKDRWGKWSQRLGEKKWNFGKREREVKDREWKRRQMSKAEEKKKERGEARRKQQGLWATCYRFSLWQCLYNGKGRATERLNSQMCQGELSRFVISIFCVCETECLWEKGFKVCACVSVCKSVCLVVRLSIDGLERKENEKEIDTKRQYMFLICPLCVRENKIMPAADVSVTNVRDDVYRAPQCMHMYSCLCMRLCACVWKSQSCLRWYWFCFRPEMRGYPLIACKIHWYTLNGLTQCTVNKKSYKNSYNQQCFLLMTIALQALAYETLVGISWYSLPWLYICWSATPIVKKVRQLHKCHTNSDCFYCLVHYSWRISTTCSRLLR